MLTSASTATTDAFSARRSGLHPAVRIAFGLLCVLVSACASCTETKPDVAGDEIYRAVGFCRDRTTGSPLAGVVVSYLKVRADSSGFHFVAHNRDTTDTSGHYRIFLDFWLHGALGFEKSGFRPDIYDVCAGCLRASPDEDHELRLDVLLQAGPSGLIGVPAEANWGQHNNALQRPAGAGSVGKGRCALPRAGRR